MMQVIATVGNLGRLGNLGAFLASLLGLLVALALFAATHSTMAVFCGWGLLMIIAAVVLPRAQAAGVPAEQIVIDRFVGVWLAAAPAIPLSSLITQGQGLAAFGGLIIPLCIYHLLLAGPFRRFARSDRLLYRLGDDLLAGAVTMLLLIPLMGGLLMLLGGPQP